VGRPDPEPLAATGENAGLDVGLKDFAVLSTGEKISHPEDWEPVKEEPLGASPGIPVP
jgi:transposase